MAFAGPGDPTGKGRGFSFVKDTRKVGLVPKLLAYRVTTAHADLVCFGKLTNHDSCPQLWEDQQQSLNFLTYALDKWPCAVL